MFDSIFGGVKIDSRKINFDMFDTSYKSEPQNKTNSGHILDVL